MKLYFLQVRNCRISTFSYSLTYPKYWGECGASDFGDYWLGVSWYNPLQIWWYGHQLLLCNKLHQHSDLDNHHFLFHTNLWAGWAALLLWGKLSYFTWACSCTCGQLANVWGLANRMALSRVTLLSPSCLSHPSAGWPEHVTTEEPEKKQKQVSTFMKSTYTRFSTVPLTRASHMTKSSISAGGQLDGMITEGHGKLAQYLLRLDSHVVPVTQQFHS